MCFIYMKVIKKRERECVGVEKRVCVCGGGGGGGGGGRLSNLKEE